MTSNDTSTVGHFRPRVRRSLGGVAAAAALAMPLAFAPAASADSNPVGGLDQTLFQTITSLPNTLAHPLGGSGATGGGSCQNPVLISPFLSCLIDKIDDLLGGPQAQTTAKRQIKAKVRAVRKVARVHATR